MGCDIHPVIVVKEAGSMWWTPVAIPPRDRCYPFFEALAHVRSGYGKVSGAALAPERGFPSDMTGVVSGDLHEQFLTGDHSASWANLAEMRAFDATWLKDAYAGSVYPFDLWQRWLAWMEFVRTDYGVLDDHVRVLFNFDN